jgi:hypothetical protein
MSSNTTFTPISATTAAVTNRLVTSTNMANGAYTVANASPVWEGGCFVTATITAATGNDTPGTLTLVGTDLAGNAQTEVLTLVAASTATSSKVYRTLTSATQAGWVINGGNDTIVVGCAAGSIACGTSGTVYGIIVNTTAAATVVLSDSARTIATLKASITEGVYNYGPGIDFTGYLKVATTSTNDVTVISTPTNPSGA